MERDTLTFNKKSLTAKWRKLSTKGVPFYFAMAFLHLLQFFVFYIIVNFNSVLLAFRSLYITQEGGLVEEWVGWQNFKTIFSLFAQEKTMLISLANSAIFLALDLFIIIPLGVMFAYYIYLKRPFAELFKTLLFMPSVICSMVFVIFFKDFVEAVVPALAEKWFNEILILGVFNDPSRGLMALMIFYVFISFSGQILLYVNAMSAISKPSVEAAKIDGASEFCIFLHVALPSCWGTIVSLAVICIAAVVTNQAYLFSFYGNSAPGEIFTIGYYQWTLLTKGKGSENMMNYPIASAFGLLSTVVATPLTFGAKWLLHKLGPKEE